MATTPTSVLGNSQIPNLPAHMTANRKAAFNQSPSQYQPQQQLSSRKTSHQQQSQAQSLRALLKDTDEQLPGTSSTERPATLNEAPAFHHPTNSQGQQPVAAFGTSTTSSQPLNAPKGPRRKQRLDAFNKNGSSVLPS